MKLEMELCDTCKNQINHSILVKYEEQRKEISYELITNRRDGFIDMTGKHFCCKECLCTFVNKL